VSDKSIAIRKGSNTQVQRLRDTMPDWEVVDARPSKRWYIDAALVWFMLFGVWPFADPGHDLDTAASALDVVLHWTAIVLFWTRWRIERRTR
jgi:hypothetical protein